jgi:4-amino-4-deoxy-L-arabinose transferase-like glycosyltransferase
MAMLRGRPLRQAWLLALAFFALRCFVAAHMDLAEDEAYYWEWSRTPALSYYDQGPGLALAIRLGTALLGPNELGVRLVSLLGGLAISGLAIYNCAVELALPALAPWAVLAFNGLLLFAVGGVMMMHDSLLGLFWMAALTAALAARRDPRCWLAVGLAAGCGFLSKYTGLFLFLCLGLYAFARPQERARVARSPWFWLGGGLGSLGALPILLWNRAQGWPSFAHVGSLAGGDPSRHARGAVFELIGSQLGLATPLLCGMVLAAWLWAWDKRSEGGEAADARWLLWACSAPVALFFLTLSLRTRVEGNWPAPAYLGGLLLVLPWLAEGPARPRLQRWSVGLGIGLSLLVYAQVLRPFLPIPASRAKLDTAARVDGWRQLGQRVQAERAAMGGAFVAARTYQNAAELAFYQSDQPRTLILQEGQINHQYRFWNHPEAVDGQNAVLVVGQDWELGEMAIHFKKVERQSDQVLIRRGIEVRRTQIYRAWGFKAPQQEHAS